MIDYENEFKDLVNSVVAYTQTVKKCLADKGGRPEDDAVLLKACMDVFIKKVREQLTEIKNKMENEYGKSVGLKPANDID